jgi:hypothetical protein
MVEGSGGCLGTKGGSLNLRPTFHLLTRQQLPSLDFLTPILVNSILDPGKPYSYLRQMDSYIRSSGIEKTNFGIIIFSTATQEHWKEIKKQEQKIIWIGLSPASDTKTRLANEQAIEKITQIITLCGKK